MKVVRGINPDYADDDELDIDAMEALEDFRGCRMTFEGLKAVLGKEAAESVAAAHGYDETSSLFDDPEDY
jgi:hypothetical protein